MRRACKFRRTIHLSRLEAMHIDVISFAAQEPKGGLAVRKLRSSVKNDTLSSDHVWETDGKKGVCFYIQNVGFFK